MLQSHLTVNHEISVCSDVIRISQAPFIRFASHLAGLLLRTQGSVKVLNWGEFGDTFQ